MHYQGIIFDLDGTLAETEPLHIGAWLDTFRAYGMQFEKDWFHRFIGLPDRVLAEAVVLDYPELPAVEILQADKRRRYHAMARSQAQLYRGVIEGLSGLQPHFRIGMATSSSDADAAGVFHRTGLDRYFEVIITADKVSRLKPDPECYLKAAGSLRLRPEHCYAVEDSPAGVEAAKSAGLHTIGLTTSHTPEALRLADRIFPEVAEAMAWILENRG